MRAGRRIEKSEAYWSKSGSVIEFISEKSDVRAFHGSKVSVLRGGLNDTIGLRRVVVMGVALRRVGVKGFRVRLVRL